MVELVLVKVSTDVYKWVFEQYEVSITLRELLGYEMHQYNVGLCKLQPHHMTLLSIK